MCTFRPSLAGDICLPGDSDARAFTIDFGLLVVLSITVLSLLYLLPLPYLFFQYALFSCAHLISNTFDDGSVEPSRLAETVPVTQDRTVYVSTNLLLPVRT